MPELDNNWTGRQSFETLSGGNRDVTTEIYLHGVSEKGRILAVHGNVQKSGSRCEYQAKVKMLRQPEVEAQLVIDLLTRRIDHP